MQVERMHCCSNHHQSQQQNLKTSPQFAVVDQNQQLQQQEQQLKRKESTKISSSSSSFSPSGNNAHENHQRKKEQGQLQQLNENSVSERRTENGNKDTAKFQQENHEKDKDQNEVTKACTERSEDKLTMHSSTKTTPMSPRHHHQSSPVSIDSILSPNTPSPSPSLPRTPTPSAAQSPDKNMVASSKTELPPIRNLIELAERGSPSISRDTTPSSLPASRVSPRRADDRLGKAQFHPYPPPRGYTSFEPSLHPLNSYYSPQSTHGPTKPLAPASTAKSVQTVRQQSGLTSPVHLEQSQAHNSMQFTPRRRRCVRSSAIAMGAEQLKGQFTREQLLDALAKHKVGGDRTKRNNKEQT